MGQVYVEVTGASVNRMARATGSEGGMEGGGYWLLWNSEGFIGVSWYWGVESNYLSTGWANAVQQGNGFVDGCNGEDGNAHEITYESFYYHVTHGHAENINSVLGAWSNQDKNKFVNHDTELYNTSCVSWT